MRVLVVTNLMPPAARGGYELECAEAVDALRAAGHAVAVCTSREAGGPLPWLTLTTADALRAPLHAVRGTRVMRRALSPRPDLVWIWNGSQLPVAALIACHRSGAPVAYRVCEHWFGHWMSTVEPYVRHLHTSSSGPRRAWDRVIRAIDRLPGLRLRGEGPTRAAISWVSEALRATTPVPPVVAPVLQRVVHPATSRATAFVAVERAPAAAPLLSFVGRVDERKGADLVVRAAAALRERHGVVARVELAGAPDPALDVAAVARECGIEAVLRGPLDVDGLCDLLARAHVLVLPARWPEPFGLVAAEAALARVPVVAADTGGLSEALGGHARFHAVGDVVGCADAIAATLRDGERTAELVAAAHAHARAHDAAAYRAATVRFAEDAVEALT